MGAGTRFFLLTCVGLHGQVAWTTSQPKRNAPNGKHLMASADSPFHHQTRRHDAEQTLAMLLLASSSPLFQFFRPSSLSDRSLPPEMVPRVKEGDLPIALTSLDVSSSSSSQASDWSGDLLVFPFQQVNVSKDLEADGRLASVDTVISKALIHMVTLNNFTGKAGTSAVIMLPPGSSASYLAVIGIGEAGSMKPSDAAKLGESLAQIGKNQKAKTMGVLLPSDLAISDALQQTMVEHLYLDLSPDNRFKSDLGVESQPSLEKIEFLGGLSPVAITRARKFASGVLLTRSLVNSPANYVTPTVLASTAKALAKEFPSLTLKVLEEKQCAEMGMGAYLGVSQGAKEPPKFIHLTYSPRGGKAKKKVVLIGKGLTFDSGGYNIKAGAGSMIEKMKIDMGGSGAVLGAARAIAELEVPDVEVHFIVAACENMVSAEAMRPGDILKASNGKTIEVLNTDAEGRLTLADALVYADRLKNVDVICDVATLTGACIVALGPKYGAVFSDDKELVEKIESSASSQGELIWRMPLAAEYNDQLKSQIADLKNLGSPGGGGSITAALFLKEFIRDKEKGSPDAMWAHIDMAGPVFNDKDGATGYGVRTLTGLVESISADSK